MGLGGILRYELGAISLVNGSETRKGLKEQGKLCLFWRSRPHIQEIEEKRQKGKGNIFIQLLQDGHSFKLSLYNIISSPYHSATLIFSSVALGPVKVLQQGLCIFNENQRS